MTTDERRRALEAIADEVRTCTRCRLHEGRTRAVPGEGHPDTEVVFVGEGPGFNEDQQGRPFVGAAGSFLNELLRSVDWARDEVFITNVVKCRPPGNRDPEQDEIAACAPFLRRQLEVLDPALVVTLGRFSLNTFMPGARIGAAHGTTRPVDPATGATDATAYAMYHPAVAFRQAALRDTLRVDMAGIPQALLDSRARRAAARPATMDEPSSVGAVAEPARLAGSALPSPADPASIHPASDDAAGAAGVVRDLHDDSPAAAKEAASIASAEVPSAESAPHEEAASIASAEVPSAESAPHEDAASIEVILEVPTAGLVPSEPDPGSSEQLGLF